MMELRVSLITNSTRTAYIAEVLQNSTLAQFADKNDKDLTSRGSTAPSANPCGVEML